MFTPVQVKQFKEAFNMIDQDGDGRVTEGDLKVMLTNLGESRSGSGSCSNSGCAKEKDPGND